MRSFVKSAGYFIIGGFVGGFLGVMAASDNSSMHPKAVYPIRSSEYDISHFVVENERGDRFVCTEDSDNVYRCRLYPTKENLNGKMSYKFNGK